MKIIDFELKGNLVRFTLGDDNCDDYWGDDWNDAPYDCNAGPVYPEYERGYVDIVFPWEYDVHEPSSYIAMYYISKEDMKERKYPCIVATRNDGPWSTETFWSAIADESAKRYYFGDKIDDDLNGKIIIYGE